MNDSRELKIVLDTGKPSPGLTLFDRDLGDELKLKGTRTLRVSGAGKGQVSYGMVVKSTKLSLAGLDIENQRVVILQSNTMQGASTDGVIGYTLFGSYVVKIDYDKKIITLISPSEFEPDPTW